ncbi:MULTISPECIES: DUF397 domain-containing protein [unclassified Saccharopolyspora]|uniref:DUF397 domain-containing protein n=1 Tax=unclassified Saccharopolyspora TaxID=2646250 RepID=UPI001CD574EC|nr:MULTISPECIES: DUF397 domain-containing protein [unclassified Saccharopolyspora]MCA1189560.1 DUF397 domain-containing protein [Saccharopolyspora sp. 6T]MCA1228994.1 DUF397 domain-containing protein [Saccharopolyspora sp. 6M]MCA1282802.1 DUF397 domain-containing protein [Saccharopolyspora sp. 7B]
MSTSCEPGDLTWRKSSRSVTEECVEIAAVADDVAVRDSKDPSGPVLLVSRAAFRRFTETIR